MNLNGQEYESYYLTAEEKAVVDAMRAGASIDVTLRIDETPDPIDEVDKFFAGFNCLTTENAFVHDRTDFEIPYIGFSKFFRDSKIIARVSVHLERVVG
jgi:hypothetical protein